jgi:hypothetical protein
VRETITADKTLLYVKKEEEGMYMWLEAILGIVATEALVELWFHAAPLQPVRRFIVRVTPFLFSREQETHLFECKYCLSFWAAVFVMALYLINKDVFCIVTGILMFHRMANFLHIVISFIRDKQIDLRVARRVGK